MIMNILLTSAGIVFGVIITYPIAYADGWTAHRWRQHNQEPRG